MGTREPPKSPVARLLPDSMQNTLRRIRHWQFLRGLSPASSALVRSDEQGESALRDDPGPVAAIDLALDWLCLAQDRSRSQDRGVARHFSLLDGWSASYPETTGYIIPTILNEAEIRSDDSLRQRAKAMLDWLVGIQFPEGGFQGGLINSVPKTPVTFNTGQILIGLARGARDFGPSAYLEAMHRAAAWLVQTQDGDGCWRSHPTPFAALGEKTYETHVALGLFEAERVAPGFGYGDAGIRQVQWALGKQHPNGWLADCCLIEPDAPLTHTLGYALRGIIGAYEASADPEFLHAAVRTADGLLSRLHPNGFMAGRFDAAWNPTVRWSCLTGTVQVANCWFLLAELAKSDRFLEAGLRANSFVRRTLIDCGEPGIVGGIRGSWPISGDYGQYQFLNWAAKFFVDSNRAEMGETNLGAA